MSNESANDERSLSMYEVALAKVVFIVDLAISGHVGTAMQHFERMTDYEKGVFLDEVGTSEADLASMLESQATH